MGSEGAVTTSGGIQRWAPGVALLGSYRRRWLRFDLVAGVVLAAILVPQGMAYAELAGLPAVTGLYTTIACLVGYAIFGPSRILVLGPDSSVAPLIFAALVPLLVTNDPAEAIALAGMMALIVGRDRGRARPREARLRRGSALERGAGRLHERPGRHDHRGTAAEAVRLLHRRRRLHRRMRGVRAGSRSDGRDGPGARPGDARGAPARAARVEEDPGGPGRGRRRDGGHRRPRPGRRRGRHGRGAAAGAAHADVPLRAARHDRRAAGRRARDRARVAHRHDRDLHELRRSPR